MADYFVVSRSKINPDNETNDEHSAALERQLAQRKERKIEGVFTMISLDSNELTTQEAAAILRISRQTLLGLLDDNVIPSRQVGVRRRLLISDINSYLKKQRVRKVEMV